MAVLSNPKHERFAQELAKGKTADEAYALAGYAPNRGNATRLKANESVEARVAELQSKAAQKVEITVADIVKQLDEDRSLAREKGQVSAAVSATLGKAKVLGLIKERHEHTGRNGGPIEYRDLSEDEIDARLDALSKQHGRQQLAH